MNNNAWAYGSEEIRKELNQDARPSAEDLVSEDYPNWNQMSEDEQEAALDAALDNYLDATRI